MNDPNILVALDACRPRNDDLHLSEMAAAATAIDGDPALRSAVW